MSLCPAFVNPDGVTGCKAQLMAEKLDSLDCAINGVPASPGVPEVRGMKDVLREVADTVKSIESRRWRRSDKIAIAAIVVPILTALISWGAYSLYDTFAEMNKAMQELHIIYKTQIQGKGGVSESGDYIFTRNSNVPQLANTDKPYKEGYTR